MPPQKTDPKSARDLGSPYGPQPDGDDEAAGGADSSPHETEPSGVRQEAAEGEGLPGSQASEPGDASG
jgi:hypothetical protein